MTLEEMLAGLARGSIETSEAERFLASYGFIEIGHQKLDVHRARRITLPEVVYGKSKSVTQLAEIIRAATERHMPLLVTKLQPEKAADLDATIPPDSAYHAAAELLAIGRSNEPVAGRVAVVSAGSSDFPVAEEAAETLAFFGAEPLRAYDCGVAGLHRLFASGDSIASSDVVIVVAGMDGALPSVVGGMFAQPVVAVPTSVGYGAAFEGLAALLTMLNSCAPGITVVNIDNGFGAAVAARAMLRLKCRRSEV